MSQESAKFRILFVISQFYRSVWFRGVPWGSGRRFGGVAINTNQHPTWKCEKNEITADGRRRKKTERMSQESVKFRILFVISQFYRSVGFRGVPGNVPEGWPLTLTNTQRGNAKKKNETTADELRRQKTERMSQESVKFRILFVFSQFYRSVGFRGVPGDVPDGWPLTPTNTQRGNAKKKTKPPRM